MTRLWIENHIDQGEAYNLQTTSIFPAWLAARALSEADVISVSWITGSSVHGETRKKNPVAIWLWSHVCVCPGVFSDLPKVTGCWPVEERDFGNWRRVTFYVMQWSQWWLLLRQGHFDATLSTSSSSLVFQFLYEFAHILISHGASSYDVEVIPFLHFALFPFCI